MLDSATTSATLGSLSCGTSYSLAVDAYDAAGNRSKKATIQASTTPCVAAGPSPPKLADSTPPSAPQGLSTSGATATSINVSWLASNDDTARHRIRHLPRRRRRRRDSLERLHDHRADVRHDVLDLRRRLRRGRESLVSHDDDRRARSRAPRPTRRFHRCRQGSQRPDRRRRPCR